ncbi:MAG: hypothetical protein IJM91_07140 [Lachnospiraceae bacterium]|nr:hypothetical protein [Lachnospiraceae bacterium]
MDEKISAINKDGTINRGYVVWIKEIILRDAEEKYEQSLGSDDFFDPDTGRMQKSSDYDEDGNLIVRRDNE